MSANRIIYDTMNYCPVVDGDLKKLVTDYKNVRINECPNDNVVTLAVVMQCSPDIAGSLLTNEQQNQFRTLLLTAQQNYRTRITVPNPQQHLFAKLGDL